MRGARTGGSRERSSSGTLWAAEIAARELRGLSLHDALDPVALIAQSRPDRLEPAAIRWHGRLEIAAKVQTTRPDRGMRFTRGKPIPTLRRCSLLRRGGSTLELRLGAPVRFNGRVYRIRGFTPSGARVPRVMLEEIETLEVIEVTQEELQSVGRAVEDGTGCSP